MKTCCIPIAALFLALATGAAADTLHVPGDYPTIQAAVNAAQGGDLVLVADGEFVENVNTLGKAITVKSLNGRDSCAVYAFTVTSGEGPGTRIEGFDLWGWGSHSIAITDSSPTIEDCFAWMLVELKNSSASLSNVMFWGEYESGLVVSGGAPSLDDCAFGAASRFTSTAITLTRCTADGIESDYGLLRFTNCTATLRDCEFVNCRSWGDAGGGNALGGVAAVVGGRAEITGSTFRNNKSGSFGYGCGGGAIYSSATSELFLVGCTFENNQATDHFGDTRGGNAVLADGEATFSFCTFRANSGSGGSTVQGAGVALIRDCAFEQNVLYQAYSGGAAILAEEGWIIEGCTFTGNEVRPDITANPDGGAVWVAPDAAVTIDACLFERNKAVEGYGGGLSSIGDATVVNCIFIGNEAIYGGATAVAGSLEVVNCTILDNTAPSGGGALYSQGNAVIANSILRGNHAGQVSGPASARYSNIEGGYAGDGNIDATPEFVDAGADDFRLAAGSPGIDAGDNGAVPDWASTDFGGLPRFVDDPATPDTGLGTPPMVDMGAHEFSTAPCYADFNGDDALDLFDFLAFVNAFNAGDDRADCTLDGALDLFDYLCFVNAFNTGC